MKIWIYQLNRILSDAEAQNIASDLQTFIERWSAHGKKLLASYEIPYHHFIVLKVDEAAALASGCSIDDSVRFLKSLESKYDLSIFDRQNMAYLKEGRVEVAPIQSIATLFAQKAITPDTVVFNNLVHTEEEYARHWKILLKDSPYMNFV